MSELWYIDALDAIAGSGFASFRAADLGSEQPDQQAIAVHIDAPFFQPVPIASRALAFAAARGSHQLGLFIDKDEVGFKTLEELTEFVRRAYLSSGGGDGAGGGGPVPPGPGPDGEGGPTIEWPVIEGETAIMLLRAAREFSEISVRLEYKSGEPVPSEPSPVVDLFRTFAAGPPFADPQALAGAAATLVAALILAAPNNDREFSAWQDPMARLIAAVGRLNLSREIGSDSRLRGLVGGALVSRQWPIEVPWAEERSDPHRAFGYFWEQSFYYWRPGPWHAWGNAEDAMDDLSLWPLPPDLAEPKIRSLRDYLAAFLGNPAILKTKQGAALILFAAVHIATQSFALAGFPLAAPRFTDRHEAAARKWLARELPALVFARNLEDMIDAARTMRAAG